MSIDHERRIRDLETARTEHAGQIEGIGTKLAALQVRVAELEERALTAEVENERLRAGAVPVEEKRGPGRPRKNPEQPQA